MRRYIRHPSDIPIEYELEEGPAPAQDKLRNISRAGLCFRTDRRLEPGTTIRIRIPFVRPCRPTTGVIAWCREVDGQYDVGVEFTDEQSEFQVRMVEQICYIERYKREVSELEGRTLTSEEAAAEWIDRYAANFPR